MTTGTIYEAPRATPRAGETIVTSTCSHNRGGRCVVNAHVRDDRIVRISIVAASTPSGKIELLHDVGRET